jgi:hypothetical protein
MDAGALLALLEPYHITDRALLRAKRDAQTRRDEASCAALVRAMQRYFGSMEQETVAHLAALERRFDDLYQRQYNLQAERGVAERRLAGSRSVLAALDGKAAR